MATLKWIQLKPRGLWSKSSQKVGFGFKLAHENGASAVASVAASSPFRMSDRASLVELSGPWLGESEVPDASLPLSGAREWPARSVVPTRNEQPTATAAPAKRKSAAPNVDLVNFRIGIDSSGRTASALANT